MKYLEKIVSILLSGGFVASHKGAKGGYSLVEAPENITLDQVFGHLEASIAPVSCLESGCPRQDFCLSRSLWMDLDAHNRKFLRQTNLRQLIQGSLLA